MSYIYNRQSIPGHLLSLPGKGQACHSDINVAVGITISSLLRNKIFTLSTYLLHCSTIPVCEVLHPVIWIIWQYLSYRWVIPSDVVPTYSMNIYSCQRKTKNKKQQHEDVHYRGYLGSDVSVVGCSISVLATAPCAERIKHKTCP